MSLINEALKRAKKVQASSTPRLSIADARLQPVSARAAPLFGPALWIRVLLIAAVLLGIWFLSAWWHYGHRASLGQRVIEWKIPSANPAPKPRLADAPPLPKASHP